MQKGQGFRLCSLEDLVPTEPEVELLLQTYALMNSSPPTFFFFCFEAIELGLFSL